MVLHPRVLFCVLARFRPVAADTHCNSGPDGVCASDSGSRHAMAVHGRCFGALDGVVVDEGRTLDTLHYGQDQSRCAEACGATSGCFSFSLCEDEGRKCWLKDRLVGASDAQHFVAGCRTYYEVPCNSEATAACDINAGEICAELHVGSRLKQGQFLTSRNRQFQAVLEGYRIAIYLSPGDTATVIWEMSVPGEISHMFIDGQYSHPQIAGEDASQLVDALEWGRHGLITQENSMNDPHVLVLTDQGELQVRNRGGMQLWTSASRGMAAAAQQAAAAEREDNLRAERMSGCTHEVSCQACVAAGCGWCVAALRCVPDEPHFCNGPHDHVGNHGSGECTVVEAPRQSASSSAKQPPAKNVREELRSRAANANEESGAARPYEVLGVARDAAPSAIRRAYRRLSLRLHPDKHPQDLQEDATLAFADLVAAYDVIGNPDKRNEYDSFEGSADDFEKRWEGRGGRADEDFYFGHPLISTLTDKLWNKRVVSSHGHSIWLIEFYASWCRACRSMMPKFIQVAERLDSDEIDVGAANCAKNPEICRVHVPIKTLPTIVLMHPAQGMVQWYSHPQGSVTSASADDIVEWARQVAREWRWLFANSVVHSLEPAHWEDGGSLQNSSTMWVVLFTDGLECKPCKSAKTNLMRLSSSVAGLPVSTGVMDCSAHRAFCHDLHKLPPSPFRPVVKLWPRGAKTSGDLGHSVYSSDELEPHVALRVLDAAIRAALAPEMDIAAATALAQGAPSDFQGVEPEPEEPPADAGAEPPRPRKAPPPEVLWEGPSIGALPGRRQGSTGENRQDRRPELMR